MTKQELSINFREKSIKSFFNLKKSFHNSHMPETITVQIPADYKGKITIDVSEPEINSQPRPKPKSKKLPKNWDKNIKQRGPDGRYVKDTLNEKKIKLDCQIKHSREFSSNDSCLA